MKKVLSLLVAYVFLQTQTWALSGGPDYTQGQGNSVNAMVGTYSGVLIPENDGGSGASPTIGLFTATIPTTGLAEGTAIVFANGTAFQGNILGFADPDSLELTAMFTGLSNYEVIVVPQQVFTDINGNTVEIEEVTEPLQAQGTIEARIEPGAANAFSGGQGGTTTTGGFFSRTVTTTDVGTNDGGRVVGTAEIETFFLVDSQTGRPIPTSQTTYAVDGFKQSNTVSSSTTTFDFFF